jgi:hypothetical protein
MHLIGLIAVVLSAVFGQADRVPALRPYALPTNVQTTLERVAAESDVLILGELHGTQEVATVSAALLGPLSKLGYGVLALEIPVDQKQPLLNWATGKTQTVPPFFAQPTLDGRNSLQTLALIRSAISERGWTLVCFDDAPLLASPPTDFTAFARQRDAAMAAIVTRERKRIDANPKVLAICGNVHARTSKSIDPKNPLNEFWPSFAATLKETNPTWRVHAINVVAHSGEFFAAISQEGDETMPVLKAHPIRSRRKIEAAEANRLEKGQWDWELHLPKVTAATFHATPVIDGRTPNDVVLAKVRAIPDGGGYNWVAGSTGVPEEIRFKDTLILRKGEGGTYCCGITFAVAMQAADELKMLDDLSPADVKLLQKRFYGVPKDAQELQCVMGLAESGLGYAVSAEEAKAGDFLQFYRGKDGHSVVFLKWVEENGQRVGFTYRSSQKSTDGVGDKTEYFSDAAGKEGKVDRKRMYFGRLGKRP